MLVLTAEARDAMVATAREGAPREVCGVLGGELNDAVADPTDRESTNGATGGTEDAGARTAQASHVTTALKATNVADTPRTRYALDPAEQLELMTRIEEIGEEVVGFYHSHPAGPPEASGTDLELATWPGRSYVIVSLGSAPPSVTSWRYTGDAFEQERVDVQ